MRRVISAEDLRFDNVRGASKHQKRSRLLPWSWRSKDPYNNNSKNISRSNISLHDFISTEEYHTINLLKHTSIVLRNHYKFAGDANHCYLVPDEFIPLKYCLHGSYRRFTSIKLGGTSNTPEKDNNIGNGTQKMQVKEKTIESRDEDEDNTPTKLFRSRSSGSLGMNVKHKDPIKGIVSSPAKEQKKDRKHHRFELPKESFSRSSGEYHGKYLKSLGYSSNDPVDWKKVQLPNKSIDLMQELNYRISNKLNTDTVVNISKSKFDCHRLVLQIYSPFISSNHSTDTQINLLKTKVTPEAFQSIYQWMIATEADCCQILTRENVLDIYRGANYLEIKNLDDECWSFMSNNQLFKEDTAFALYKEAKAKKVASVMNLMVSRIKRFFLPLVASNDFLELDAEELTTLLQSDEICVTSEMEVLMSGVRWLRSEWPSRRAHVVEVMGCVRFGLISPWQLVDVKRNPDNQQLVEIVTDPAVQEMIDDGLAFVIIKYWYGNNSTNYFHWIDVLGLREPAERNWIGEEQKHITYKDFLDYLEAFTMPKEQMYQQLEKQPFRKKNKDSESRKKKYDFPLPAALKDSEFSPVHSPGYLSDEDDSGPARNRTSPRLSRSRKLVPHARGSKDEASSNMPESRMFFDLPERDDKEDAVFSSPSYTLSDKTMSPLPSNEKRRSLAACFLAEATAAINTSRPSIAPTVDDAVPTTSRQRTQSIKIGDRMMPKLDLKNLETQSQVTPITSPQISLFNDSKEFTAKLNMNKLSKSVLGPTNKNYTVEGSLFNWDRETVLVFGGIDPHTAYGTLRNTGKDIYRYDPVTNVWDKVGEMPEPRHHHSVVFFRGRVFLVGGADPRDDDIRGKSVVMPTMWSFEPVTRSWVSESGLTIPRKNFGLVSHKMSLYAIGGQDKKGKVLRSVERFDSKKSSWSEVRPMGTARMALAVAKYRDYIWVAGGMTGQKKEPLCNVVECYDSKTNEWTQIHSLRFPRCFSSLFSLNDQLYLVGGAGRLNDKEKTATSMGAIDVWNWPERTWVEHTEMSIPRHGHALAYLGTQIIIIGGVTTIYMRALANVESFCCDRNAWIRGVSALPCPLSGHGAVTLPPASLML